MNILESLEPHTKLFIENLQKQGGPPIYKMSISEARNVLETLQSTKVEKAAVRIEDTVLPCGKEGDISVRIVRPEGGNGNLPVILYFHGGGWILGSKNTHDHLIRELAVNTHAAVVFVNYSRSPEIQFPVPIEEAYAATKYIYEHGKKMKLDSSRLAIAGDSVGGNMAAVVAILAKERKGPKILQQVLFYPVTDASMNTESYKQFAEGPWLTKPAMEWFWHAYAPNAADRKKYTASPLLATYEQLHGLPPALVITDENDVLRDEGEAYARRLMQAGVEVTSVRYVGTIHDFVMLNPLANTPAARSAINLASTHLQKAFSQQKASRSKKAA
jgi:acetyl esterase